MNRWISKPPAGIQIDRAHPLARGLVGCWIANEGSGAPRDLIYPRVIGTLPTWVGTPNGVAVQNARWTAGETAHLDFTSGEFSVVALVYVSAVPGASARCNGRSVYTSESSNRGWSVQYQHPEAKWNFVIYRDNGSASYNMLGTTTPAAQRLYHLVGTTNSTTRRLYVNGNQEASSTTNAAPLSNTSGDLILGTTTGMCTIMGLVYRRVLSPSEIQELYRQPYAFMAPIQTGRYAAMAAAAQQRNLMLLGVGG